MLELLANVLEQVDHDAEVVKALFSSLSRGWRLDAAPGVVKPYDAIARCFATAGCFTGPFPAFASGWRWPLAMPHTTHSTVSK